MTITDTTPSAQAVHWQVQRAMTGEQRLLIALEMLSLPGNCKKREFGKSTPNGRTQRWRANSSAWHSSRG